jgi:hypothetical protein
MVSFGAVKEKEFFLLDVGEYILTLSELDEAEGQWGTRMVFKWLVAPKDDFAAYIAKPNGDEHVLWTFTDQDIILGSIQHEFIEALTGRKYSKDDAPPDEDDLLGKRLIAFITHETPTRGKNAGKKREAIVAGSIKPFKGPSKKIAPNVVPADPTYEQITRDELVAKLEKAIGRAVKMETPNHKAYVALNLSEGDNDQLEQLIATVQAEVQDALDA